MIQVWIVAKDSYGDRIVYGATTSREKAEKLAAAYNAEIDETVELYEDDDPAPDYVTLYTYRLMTGRSGCMTTYNVLTKDYSPDEEAHRPHTSCWAHEVTARNYPSSEEAVAAANKTMELIRDLGRP